VSASGRSFRDQLTNPIARRCWAIGVFLLTCLGSSETLSQTAADSLPQVYFQEADSVELSSRITKAKDPKVATILSAIVPGAGQAYNEKIWKVPIIYGGIVTTAYFVEFNNRRYQKFREALAIVRDPSLGPNPFPNLNQAGIIRNVDYWRRNRDLCYLIFGVIYVLNIVDAQVDAHLSGFDVSDDLTWKLEPSYETFTAGGQSIGLSLKLNF
jgi:hypothetical protein